MADGIVKKCGTQFSNQRIFDLALYHEKSGRVPAGITGSDKKGVIHAIRRRLSILCHCCITNYAAATQEVIPGLRGIRTNYLFWFAFL